MNVLFTIASDKYSGPGAAALTMARALLQRGHAVSFLCYPDCRLQKMALKAGCTWPESLNFRSDLAWFRHYLRPGRFRDFARRHAIEIVHCHRSRDQILARRAFGQGTGPGPALVRSFHPASTEGLRDSAVRLLGTAHRLSVNNRDVADTLATRHPPLASRVTVVHGAVDRELFDLNIPGAPIRRQLGVPEDALLTGTISRLKPGRGHDTLLDAAARLPSDLPLRLAFLGEGELADRFRATIRERGLENRVLLFAPRAEFVRTLATLDLAVQAAPGSDGSCRAVLECLTLGVPVIAPDRATFPEIISHGETGLILEDWSPETIARTLTDLCQRRERVDALARNAREVASRRFTLAALGRRLETLYAEALMERRNG